jgi:hypothetical protein
VPARILVEVLVSGVLSSEIVPSVFCRVKARFSNQHKRLCHDILEYFSHHWSLLVTLEQDFSVKSDAKMTPKMVKTDKVRVGEGRVRRRKENPGIASGWLVALASLWIDPERHPVFTGNVQGDISGKEAKGSYQLVLFD